LRPLLQFGGNNRPSRIFRYNPIYSYLRQKELACARVGFTSAVDLYPEDVTEQALLEQIKAHCANPGVDGTSTLRLVVSVLVIGWRRCYCTATFTGTYILNQNVHDVEPKQGR